MSKTRKYSYLHPLDGKLHYYAFELLLLFFSDDLVVQDVNTYYASACKRILTMYNDKLLLGISICMLMMMMLLMMKLAFASSFKLRETSCILFSQLITSRVAGMMAD